VHALNHLRVLKGVKTTEENLKQAIEGETYEFQEMYPEMIKDAEEEKEAAALFAFKVANAVEEIHAGLYKKALDSVKSGKDMESTDVFVCQICGNTVEGEAPDECPICKAPKKMFNKI